MATARDPADDAGTVGVVLAAGAGRRMGAPKAGLALGGTTLLSRAVTALGDGGCRPVLAVVRPGTGPSPVPADVRFVVNPDPDRGMRSSLELAIEAVDPDASGRTQLLVLLVDTPGVGAAAVQAVMANSCRGRITLARYPNGVSAHPIVMRTALWRQALEHADDDRGAKEFLRRHPELVDRVDVPGDPTDLDTADDYEFFRRRNRS